MFSLGKEFFAAQRLSLAPSFEHGIVLTQATRWEKFSFLLNYNYTFSWAKLILLVYDPSSKQAATKLLDVSRQKCREGFGERWPVRRSLPPDFPTMFHRVEAEQRIPSSLSSGKNISVLFTTIRLQSLYVWRTANIQQVFLYKLPKSRTRSKKNNNSSTSLFLHTFYITFDDGECIINK